MIEKKLKAKAKMMRVVDTKHASEYFNPRVLLIYTDDERDVI